MKIKLTALVVGLSVLIPSMALADVSDGPMNRCISVKTHDACVDAFNYYLGKEQHANGDHDIICHSAMNAAIVGMADFAITDSSDDATGSHQILGVVIKNCPDPYLSHARYMRGKLDLFMDNGSQ